MSYKLQMILLIDDDEPTNFLNRLALEEANCAREILVFQSAASAIEFLQSAASGPDLIFLDINMPAMNGWEFLQEYENLGPEKQGSRIIIMLTSSINPDDRTRAEQNPAVSGFRNKPLTPEIIQEIMDSFFT